MTSNSTSADPAVAILLDLERQRCAAMMAGDRERLRQLLHTDLIHVHAKGQVDDYESYFATGGFNVDYQNVERFDVRVRVMGSVALMSGRQLLQAVRKSTGLRVHIDSQVMQVWVVDGTNWRQIAFQTTPTDMSIGP